MAATTLTVAVLCWAAPVGGDTATSDCHGAAARDAQRACDRARTTAVTPTPAQARTLSGDPCRKIDVIQRKPVCEFGVEAAAARDTIALVGDSHAGHWRGAVEVVAQAKGWRGIRIGHASCPLNTALRDLPEPSRTSCARWKRKVFQWFEAHPEVTTVFVSQLSSGSGYVPRGRRSRFETAVRGYAAAWRALPASVRHIVVIRDTPKVLGDTDECVERAIRRAADASETCAVPRGKALPRDPAVVAARRLASPRVQTVDLTRYFCARRVCLPVVGGVLVHKDSTHVTPPFIETVGPYLLRAVDRLMATWGTAARAASHGSAAAARRPCFGAPVRDPAAACDDPELDRVAIPGPREARTLPNPCPRIERHGPLSVCAFGVPAADAAETVALVGDSHAGHWRAAFEKVAQRRGWRGLSITHSSCPLQKALRDLPEPRRTSCARWKRRVFAWFERHPEVRRVFVAGLTGGSGVVPGRGQSQFEARVQGYVDAWRALLATPRTILVIRDTPKAASATGRCILRALRAGRAPGSACALPRREALDPDPAITAAARMASDAVRTLDLTPLFCDARRCFPVVGGALVLRDQNHLTATFAATAGLALDRAIDRTLRR